MASLKALRRRIASVKSTQQTTRAMKLVSAAKLRRAQEALAANKPFALAAETIVNQLPAEVLAALNPPAEAAEMALVVLIASDRGLCGSYNANLMRLADETARRFRERGFDVRFFAVGRKAVEHLNRQRLQIARRSVQNQRLASRELAMEIADWVLETYQRGEASMAGIIFSRFKSALVQYPEYREILPIGTDRRAESALDGEPRGATDYYLLEPTVSELAPPLMRLHVEAEVLAALLEAEASEHAARMTAMDAATNNASEMIEHLTLAMNRARQASITAELMDIVGGAEALREARG